MRIEHNEEYDSYYSFADKSDGFQHFGRPGQRWYQRLYQYKDGSLTPLGRIHYGVGPKRNKEMKSKSYTTSDYEGFHAYKKNRKYSSYKGKGDRLNKKASDSYNEDIVTDMAKNKALKDLGKDAYFSDKKVLGVFKKLDKEKVQNLSDQYANSEEFRRIKAYLDARKDDVIDISKEKKPEEPKEKYPYEGYEDAPKNKKEEEQANRQDGYSKENESPLKSLSNDELKKEFQENPYTLDDLSDGYKQLWKEFGLSKEDLYITDEGHVSRKDNKPFIYEERYHDGTIVKNTSTCLDGLPNFWDDDCKAIDSSDYKGPSASQLNGAFGQLYDSLYRIRDGKGTKNGKPIGLGSKEAKAMTFVWGNVDKYLNNSGEWIYKNKKYDHSDELIKEIAKNGDYAPVDKAKSLEKQGLTIEEIAKQLGVSNRTIVTYLYG